MNTSANGIVIRDACVQDLDDVFALICAKAEYDGGLDLLAAKKEDIHTAFFSALPQVSALVAEQDNKLVGLATYYQIFSTFIAKPGIWLDDLFVYEPYRKLGVGKALMTRLCKIAHESGCARVDWIVARDNENGRGFYESLGARIFEDIRHCRLEAEAICTLSKYRVPAVSAKALKHSKTQ